MIRHSGLFQFRINFYSHEQYRYLVAISVAARSEAWTVFAGSNAGGSNPTQDIYVCVRLFYVLFYVYVEALRRGHYPSKDSYPLCILLRNWNSSQGPTKGCRTIDRSITGVQSAGWLDIDSHESQRHRTEHNRSFYHTSMA
jgi:hypothetical protein